MKKLIPSIAILFASTFTTFAQTDSVSAEAVPTAAPVEAQTPAVALTAAQADSAYSADKFTVASQGYLNAIKTQGPSAKLYYNLGNSYYRMGELGKAILAYERALRLDPTDQNARFNLEFVNARITDRPGERGTLAGNILNATANFAHSNTWAWFALGFFALTLAGIMAYLFVDVIALRKLGFFGGFVTLILCGLCIYFSFRSAAISMAKDVAIVTAPSTILSTAPRTPRDRSQEAMLLHEGTKVTILDSVTSSTDSVPTKWYDVEVDNTHRAWINSKAVEII